MASPPGRETKRCWDCRSRKISCDRTKPGCNNCARAGRQCLGYGLKLSWPRDDDKKRLTRAGDHFTLPLGCSDVEFVNASLDDLAVQPYDDRSRRSNTGYPLYRVPERLYANVAQVDPVLGTTGQSPVAHGLKVLSGPGGLYEALMRLSLNDDSSSALATRHAISAISYQHLAMGSVADMHQAKAASALQSAIDHFNPSSAMQMIAASMLLTLYKTLTFMQSPGPQCAVFFTGTNSILHRVSEARGTWYSDDSLILNWISYLDVMYKFSVKMWRNKTPGQMQLVEQESRMTRALFSPERRFVMPTLGCSLELLDLFSEAIDAVHAPGERPRPQHELQATIRSIELRLLSLEQYALDSTGNESGAEVAEICRLAALVYLYRLARRDETTSQPLESALSLAYSKLRNFNSQLKAWAVFILGVEARTEDRRLIACRALRCSLGQSPAGTVPHVWEMIQRSWNYQDLQDDPVDAASYYIHVINQNPVPPCFS